MEAVMAIAVGLLTACGVYLLLRARTFPVVLGLTLLSYGVNLFLFSMGRLVRGAPAIIEPDGAPWPIRCPRHWCSPPSSSGSV